MRISILLKYINSMQPVLFNVGKCIQPALALLEAENVCEETWSKLRGRMLLSQWIMLTHSQMK